MRMKNLVQHVTTQMITVLGFAIGAQSGSECERKDDD